ncbi:MAG: aminotransferase [Paracoccus denitrificans]|nr:MAG: aminotransferase [Paracoccus denitrificans]PZO84908.1 MAG: aminotransferase [Paracoccus denitrificans]
MTFAAGHHAIAIPGPSPVPERVLRAMHRASPDIYSDDMVTLNQHLMDQLKRVAGTTQNVAAFIGNGHAGWEAVNANLIRPGDRVLVLTSGHFGRSWVTYLGHAGAVVEVIDSGNDQAPDPVRLAERLRQDGDGQIKAVMVCHIDTATGLRADLPALRRAMADHPALFVVDAIASLGSEVLKMDEWGIDVVIAASQKGLMAPPGIVATWYSDRAAVHESPSAYWNWNLRANTQATWQRWGGTPPVQLIFALSEALTMLLDDEGLDAVWARHEGLAQATWRAFDAWGAGNPDIALNVANPDQRARSLTFARMPQADPLRAWTAANAGVTLGIGLAAEPPGSALRVAHMGHVNAHMMLGTLASMQAGMVALGIPFGPGALDAAAAEIAARVG